MSKLLAAGILSASCLTGCIQGGGTDIGNALVRGRVTDAGAAIANAKVMLMPEGYNPVLGDTGGSARIVTADGDGRFSIAGVKPGRYSLETRHPSLERMDLIRVLDLEAGESRESDPELDTSRTVLVKLPAGAATDAYVFIPGTDVRALRNSGDTTEEGLLRLRHAPAVAIPELGLGRSAAPAATALFPVFLNATDTSAVLARP